MNEWQKTRTRRKNEREKNQQQQTGKKKKKVNKVVYSVLLHIVLYGLFGFWGRALFGFK